MSDKNKTFEDLLEVVKVVFPNITEHEINLLRVGYTQGRCDETIDQLADTLKRQNENTTHTT